MPLLHTALDRGKIPWLKWLVVATSVTPLRQVYIGLYRAVIWWAGRQLYQDRFIGAVYLKHGCALGEIVPGISDIDFTVIVCNDGKLASDAHQLGQKLGTFSARYRRLAHWVPLLDPSLHILVDTQLEELYLTGYQDRYLLLDGKAKWQLLRGEDYLQQLPSQPKGIERGGRLSRIEHKWTQFSNQFLAMSLCRDVISTNSMCYRYCCDMLRYLEEFSGTNQSNTRAASLGAALAKFKGKDRAFGLCMQQVAARRFLGPVDNIVEESTHFMLRQYDNFYSGLGAHPWLQPLCENPSQVDCDPSEYGPIGALEAQIEHLKLQARWGKTLLGAYLMPSLFCGVDDLLLLLHVDVEQLPSAAQIFDLHRALAEKSTPEGRALHLFLLLPSGAYFLGGEHFYHRGWHSILPQAYVTDVFELVQQPPFALHPSGYQVEKVAPFTVQAACFFYSQRLRYRQHLEAWEEGSGSAMAFMRYWWKWLQLEVVHRSVAQGHPLYPLTLAAIERGVDAVGLPRPECLGGLAATFGRGLEGKPVQIEREKAAALAYMCRVDPQGHRFGDPPPWLFAKP